MPYAPQSSVDRTRTGDEERDGQADRAAPAGRRRLGSRIALLGLAAAVGVFVFLSVPRYLSFDPELGRLPPAEYPFYFPVMMVHVLAATVAIVTCVLQVWPWLRRRYPRVHRYVGRVYVLATWPAALGALVISVLWAFGPVSALSDIVHAGLWLGTTTYGFMLARRGRFVDHRRWMLRSFALTISNIANRFVGFPIQWMLTKQLDTAFEGSEFALQQAVSASNSWLCWVVALIAMEWWLDRGKRPRSASRRPPAARRESATVVR